MELATPEELMGEVLRGLALSMWTALPGRVVAYDKDTQRVQVQPVPDDVDGELPVLAGVPVVFPCGNGAAVVWPLSKGDTGLLVFCSRSIARWLANGTEGDPQSERHHHLGDAVFVPGLDYRAMADVQDGKLELREPTGGQVLLGKGATTPAARQGDAVQVSNAAWIAWFSAIGTVLSTPPPVDPSFGTITGGSATVMVK